MNQNQPTQSDYGECPVCHGTGWETYYATVYDYGLIFHRWGIAEDVRYWVVPFMKKENQ